MNNEFSQAVAFFDKSGNPAEHYAIAQEIINDYIENSEPADELFNKALKVVDLIKDGEGKEALKIKLI